LRPQFGGELPMQCSFHYENCIQNRHPSGIKQILMEVTVMTKERRLLKAIFNETENDAAEDNYPETFLEKAQYAEYCLIKSLEYLSPALRRVGRLRALLKAGQEGDKNTLPAIITNNESRMALESIVMFKRDADDAFAEIQTIYNETKGAVENVPKNNETT